MALPYLSEVVIDMNMFVPYIVSLDEMKQYLHVDFDDDDSIIESLIESGGQLCMNIARIDAIDIDAFCYADNAKTAVMYATAYLYEHREEADHHALTLTLRALLFGSRREGF